MIDIQLTGVERALVRLDRIKANLADLSDPLLKSGVIIRDAVILRFKRGGGDQPWAPDAASTIARKGSSKVGIDTGQLWQSIGISQSDANSITVNTNVKYAAYFQYGSRGRARNRAGGKLAAMLGGGGFFAHSGALSGGSPARPFLLISEAERVKIKAVFVRHMLAVPADAGDA